MIPYWFTMKDTDLKDIDDRECPLCAMGHKPMVRYIVPVIILKKKYKTTIQKHRATRRDAWKLI